MPRARTPWYLTVGTLAMVSAAIGEEWDASWHRSIGRDTFFTPAHLMIYLCGLLAFVVGAALIWRCTFSHAADRETAALREGSVRLLGLRAPLGVFVAGWGGVAMLTAGPFDNWWHTAYGIDTQLVSPPHALLVIGLRAVDVGMLLLVLSALNRAREAPMPQQAPYANDRQKHADERLTTLHLERLALLIGGLLLAGQMFFSLSYTRDVMLHRASAYEVMALMVPISLAAIAFASEHRWAATTAASLYTLFLCVEILLLPLFPAQPRLAPVFFPVTHMVPTRFPPLVLAPAFALDLLWQRTRRSPKGWPLLPLAVASGLFFVVVLVAVEWPLATLLMTRLGHSRVFGTVYFSFDARPDHGDRLRQFFLPQSGWKLVRGLAVAAVVASVSSAAGIAAGRWMRTLRR